MGDRDMQGVNIIVGDLLPIYWTRPQDHPAQGFQLFKPMGLEFVPHRSELIGHRAAIIGHSPHEYKPQESLKIQRL